MRTILLVDDDDFIREVASASLELMAGWTVRTAASGGQGLAMAAESPPDAIILDVMMPEMDGPTTLAALRASERTRSIPVVFLTARIQASERRWLDELGAEGVLAKPFDPEKLHEQVAEVLGWTA